MNTTEIQNSLQVFTYEGRDVTFDLGNGDVMVNLTEVAKAFPNKNLSEIVNSQEISEYVEKLSERGNSISADLLTVRKGGNPKMQGTWAHQRVALRVAQKLSTDFAIWVDEMIETLLTKGHASVNNISKSDLARMVLESEAEKERLQSDNNLLEARTEAQTKLINEIAPKAEYCDNTLTSKDTMTATQIAKELGMSGRALNKRLHSLGIQYNVGGQWLLYAKYQDRGYTKPHTYTEIINNESRSYTSTVWTQKGRRFIHNSLTSNVTI